MLLERQNCHQLLIGETPIEIPADEDHTKYAELFNDDEAIGHLTTGVVGSENMCRKASDETWC